MKRTIGSIIIVISIFLALILLLTLITTIQHPREYEDNTIGTFIAFIIWFSAIGLFFYLGRRLYRTKNKIQTPPNNESIYHQSYKLTVKLRPNEFIMLNYLESYSNFIVIFLTFIGIGMIYFVFDYVLGNMVLTNKFPIFQLVFGIWTLIGIPIIVYIRSIKSFKSNKFISEEVVYIFDSNGLNINGESFNLSINWSMVTLLKERKNWFIIFTEKNRGFFIPKNCFYSKDEELNFKLFLLELSGVEKIRNNIR